MYDIKGFNVEQNHKTLKINTIIHQNGIVFPWLDVLYFTIL